MRSPCALKLLADPDLAPARLRQSFVSLAEDWVPVTTIDATIFDDYEDVRPWLDRTHSGPQGGVGRKVWNAVQKQRFSGSNKNRLALAVLDYAEDAGLISKEERVGRLTTAQRFLNPAIFQEALGVDQSNPNQLLRTR